MRARLMVTVGQAARELCWSYPKTIRAVYEGRLMAVMLNGRWQVDAGSLAALKLRDVQASHPSVADEKADGGHDND